MIRTDGVMIRFDLRGCVRLHRLYGLTFRRNRSRFLQSRTDAIFSREWSCLSGVSIKHSLCFRKMGGLRTIRTATLYCYPITETH